MAVITNDRDIVNASRFQRNCMADGSSLASVIGFVRAPVRFDAVAHDAGRHAWGSLYHRQHELRALLSWLWRMSALARSFSLGGSDSRMR
jgi:hypothetical protein